MPRMRCMTITLSASAPGSGNRWRFVGLPPAPPSRKSARTLARPLRAGPQHRFAAAPLAAKMSAERDPSIVIDREPLGEAQDHRAARRTVAGADQQAQIPRPGDENATEGRPLQDRGGKGD